MGKEEGRERVLSHVGFTWSHADLAGHIGLTLTQLPYRIKPVKTI